MKMDREHWKKMLPIIEAFVNGAKIRTPCGSGNYGDTMDFQLGPEDYHIAKPKEKMPLEAEDWIKDGPWWIRANAEDDQPACVVRLLKSDIQFLTSDGAFHNMSFRAAMTVQRRNAASDWMPCWKEKE